MSLKLNVIALVLFVFLVSCAEEDEYICVPKSAAENTSEEDANARHADGAGTGDPTVPFGSVGNAMTWNGDGRWFSGLFGSPVWFYGPSPQQLQNGIQGIWQVTCAYYTPTECYPNGYVVDGNGSGFTVFAPACATVVSSTIDLPKLVFDHVNIVLTPGPNNTFIPTSVPQYRWENHSITVKSLSGGNCSLQASGKVIVNSQCKPVIVSPASVIANLCGQNVPVLVD